MNRVWIKAVALVLLMLAVSAPEARAGERKKLEVAGHEAFILPPGAQDARDNKPWVWYAPTLIGRHPNKTEQWMVDRLHAKGIAMAGIDVGESMGNPAGRAVYQKFYEHMVELGYSKTPVLLGRSRGGLMLYNWAVEHPDCVAGVAGIYPVCNLLSYPGLNRAAEAYKMTPQQLQDEIEKHNPIDRLEPLARQKVPIFHIHGDSDTVVPYNKNTGLLAERYKALGGPIEFELIEGGGHDMKRHWFESQPLTDFMIERALADLTSSKKTKE